jgi:hypothetical protein
MTVPDSSGRALHRWLLLASLVGLLAVFAPRATAQAASSEDGPTIASSETSRPRSLNNDTVPQTVNGPVNGRYSLSVSS